MKCQRLQSTGGCADQYRVTGSAGRVNFCVVPYKIQKKTTGPFDRIIVWRSRLKKRPGASTTRSVSQKPKPHFLRQVLESDSRTLLDRFLGALQYFRLRGNSGL